jgi:hypothetical protein
LMFGGGKTGGDVHSGRRLPYPALLVADGNHSAHIIILCQCLSTSYQHQISLVFLSRYFM